MRSDLLVKKSERTVRKSARLLGPVPIRKAAYFEDCYDREASKESNQLAAHSVCKIVK